MRLTSPPLFGTTLRLVALSFCAFVGSGLTAHAQDTAIQDAPATIALSEAAVNALQANANSPRQLVAMTLRFVPAHIMAWWLDPQHTPSPSAVGVSPENAKPVDLPKNTNWVWGDDGTGQILLYGTNQWIAERVVIAKNLDVKAPVITLNTRIARISVKERQALGKQMMGADLSESIKKLLAEGRATIVASSERNLTNNFAASLLTASTPLPPDIIALAPQGICTNLYNLVATPTVSNDGAVTLTVNVSKSYEKDGKQHKFVVQTTAVMRDNDTVAFALDSHDPDGQDILLLTPHVLRDTASLPPYFTPPVR